jgi:hypothetical protein
MAVTIKWRQHIEAWQRSGLSQAEYCAAQQIKAGTFAARLSEYRKLPRADSAALIPVHIEPSGSVPIPSTVAVGIVFTHRQGHRVELPVSMSAGWVAELLRCLA